ncbi:LETM1 domain-containing protein 1 [Lepeophtheirus salmonis]|uniref:LETM1 domain-containing protein 1 n=1 Tax=Lepeophtheirus salmonis TaxID=72036 RepID=UPI001AE82E6B|nr:LETM1 domain-containing protein 1-like [Lepeophtheirus salmonis]
MPFSWSHIRYILDNKIKDLTKDGKLSQILSLFSTGSKSLIKDGKKYWQVHSHLSHSNNWDRDCQSLTRKELQLYITFPSDFLRVLPVLIISTLPFAQNIAFPLALAFPKKLLSSHYWTNQIKKEYLLEHHSLKEKYFHAVVREFQSNLSRHLCYKGLSSLKNLIAIEQRMANGQRPDIFLLINSNHAFQYPKGTYSLMNLDNIYLRCLAKVHGQTNISFGFIRKSLQQYSAILNQVDKAIAR